jgi:hypothetical protein
VKETHTIVRKASEAIGREADSEADEGVADAEAKAAASTDESHSFGAEARAPSYATSSA